MLGVIELEQATQIHLTKEVFMMPRYLLKFKEDLTDLRIGHIEGLSSPLQYATTRSSPNNAVFVLPSFLKVEPEASLFYSDIRTNSLSSNLLLFLLDSIKDYQQHITILSFIRFFDIVFLTEPLLYQLTSETTHSYAIRKLFETTSLSTIVVIGTHATIYTPEMNYCACTQDLPTLLSTIPPFN